MNILDFLQVIIVMKIFKSDYYISIYTIFIFKEVKNYEENLVNINYNAAYKHATGNC